MNIFVTVGTTSFESLIASALALARVEEYTFRIQDPSQQRERGVDDSCVVQRFYDDVLLQYEWADLIVTHAGAGSVYATLEMGKKIIVVPNLERADKHQAELAKYIQENNYGAVLWDVNQLGDTIKIASKSSYRPYARDRFFVGNEIVKAVKASLSKKR
ncbi:MULTISPECIES: PssE/Cps14G family polysaccharide biosynthesis glycosyltransferase [Halomonas]|uniref:PssE/Cps14G family polysaccharide biosynthesis glycosyltransferase n=1 Tax=Halomonas TaxID=2745 RepID=UPI001C953D2E|nr:MULTISPECIES: PssE/Cps14G family polysaccharide biosynthesis glycosyltransferase [Halomonas]MBY6208228.1 hypothetical protein [Halomonas sp. DP3Y7-2]MBY6229037.1 hypothetical protein [Halomonas sp. DP3Y7-1]MCA0916980.1 hypothetical protein [Halomonas denitrificans]